MKKQQNKLTVRQNSRQVENNDKYLIEYNSIIEKLPFLEKEEIFSQILRLVNLCKKLNISLPGEYYEYYIKTKNRLNVELRNLEKRIIMSQINNENYSHLEKRISDILMKLGTSTP